jgi:predicted DNA-binding transcriptional regulator AlpA
MEKMATQSGPNIPERFVSIPEFVRRSSLCRATVYNMIDRGEIEKPVRLTRNRVAFPSSVVDRWFASKVEA